MFGIERGKGGSIVVWLILGVLALAFGLTFGLPSDQLSFGESGLVKVYGDNVSKSDFAYQKRAIGSVVALPEGERAQSEGIHEEVLEAIVERLLLNEVGGEIGLTADLHDAELLTRDGYYMVLDMDRPYPWAGEAKFNYQAFKNDYLPRLFLVSEPRYLEIQRQELVARQVRDLVTSSVVVPEPELWAAYEKKNNLLSLQYARFTSADYAELVDPTTAEVEAWMEEHQAELDEMYEREAARFLKLPAEVDLRLIEVSKPVSPPEGAGEEVQALWQENLAKARAKAEAARAAIVDSGESFADVARRYSEDPDTVRSGGRFGWTQVTNTGSGLDRAIDEAAAKLEDGQVSELIEGEQAFYVIQVAGHREGDVPEDEAKRELATEAVRSARGKELARAAADEAMLAIKEGADMDELFESAPALGDDPETIEDFGISENPLAKPKPEVQDTGLFNYGDTIQGIGANPALTNAAWDADMDAPIIDKVFDVPGGVLIAKVTERQVASKEDFAEAREELYPQVVRNRGLQVLSAFTKRKCYIAKAKVEVRANEGAIKKIMNYGVEVPKDENGVPLLPPYRVCSRVGDRGGLIGMRMQLAARGMPQP